MLRELTFFTVIHLVFGAAMPQMQQVILSEQDLSQRQLYLYPYRDSPQQMPHLVQHRKVLEQLHQLALNEPMQTFLHNKWEHPTEAQYFLHKPEEQETSRQITETEHYQDEQIKQHYIPQDQNNKYVDKRHQPIDTNGFDQSDNFNMDNDNKKTILLYKLRRVLQGIKMQRLQPQNDEEHRKQEKIVAKIRQLLNEQNQPEQPQAPPTMIEIEDLVTPQKESQPINQNESLAAIKNEPPQEKPFQSDNPYENENSFNQPQQQNLTYYHFAENPNSQQPPEKGSMDMQNSNIKGDEYNPQTGEQNIIQPGIEVVRQQPIFGELQYVLHQLQKNLQNLNARKSQISPSELHAKWLQEQMKKQIALGHVQADVEKKLQAPQQNDGIDESNQREPFNPQPMMSNPSQLKPEANLNVMDIMKSQDLSQNQPLQTSRPLEMSMANFRDNMNTFGPPTMMMMQIVDNMQQQTMMANSNPKPINPQNNKNQLDMTKNMNMPNNLSLQTAMWPQMANTQEQDRGYPNNIGSSMAEMMQIAGNYGWPQSPALYLRPPLSLRVPNDPSWTYPMQSLGPMKSTMTQAGNPSQQQSISGGNEVSPVMKMQKQTDPNCPNAEGCMSMSANSDKKESVGETGKLIPRAFFNLTPVSVVIAIIQNFLAFEVYEGVKLSNIAIDEAERNIFRISSNINVLSAFTDDLLFLRRRLEYLPVQIGAHYRILSQLRAKIARMGALQHETTRAISRIKVDLNSRRREALTDKSQLLTNGLINIILLIVNVIQIFSEVESLTHNALLLQGVVTVVFGLIFISNVTFFLFLGGFLTSFDGILESVAEFELQLESLTAHFHDTLDRVDFAFETPHFANANQGVGPNVKNVSFSNSGAITGALNVGGFNFGGFGFPIGRLGLPADSSFNEPAGFPPNQPAVVSRYEPTGLSENGPAAGRLGLPADSSFNKPTVFSQNEPTGFSGNKPTVGRLGLPAQSSFKEPTGFSRNQPASFSRNKPAGFSPDKKSSHLESNPVTTTTKPSKSFTAPLTTIDPPGRISDIDSSSAPSTSTIIKKPNMENVNLSNKFPLLKSIRNKLKSKIDLSKWI